MGAPLFFARRVAMRSHVLGMPLDRGHQRVDPNVRGRLRQQHWRAPSVGRPQMDAQFQFRLDSVGAVSISLVDHEQIGDLIEPGLHYLHTVAALRHRHDHGRVGKVHHAQLGLPHPNGLDHDDVMTEGVKQLDDLARRAAESAMITAARQAPDIDSRVTIMVGHANAIAKHRAAGKWARGIDSQHRDALLLRTILPDQLIHQRRFARTRRARYPDDIGMAGLRINLLHHAAYLGRPILDQGD